MKIPKVYVNNIDKTIRNNKNEYHFKKNDTKEEVRSSIDINARLNELFSGEDFVYKSKVVITLNDGTKLTEDIIALKDSHLLTLSDKKIDIKDIIDIKKAN